MKKTICKVGECELQLIIDKHGLWFKTIAPNYIGGAYPHNPIKQLLRALDEKSIKLEMISEVSKNG